MDKYTASNGAQIVLTNAGKTGYVLVERDDDVASAYLGFEEMVAWREFFRAERDEELGRWRWPENPDYVVYPDEDGDVVVINEGKGISSSIIIRRDIGTRNPDHPSTKAARAFFDAHPERKPWHDAKPGEVWAVTIDGVERALLVEHEQFTDGNEGWYFAEPEITAARRIWPESD